MTDDEFLQQFEAGTFPLDQWHHRAHVKVAYLYVTRFGLEVATRKLRDGIRAYNAANQIQDTSTGGYHETMTQAWLRIIHTTIQEYGPRATADEFLTSTRSWGKKRRFAFFYSVEVFMSPRAKQEFVEPDLTRLPEKHKVVAG